MSKVIKLYLNSENANLEKGNKIWIHWKVDGTLRSVVNIRQQLLWFCYVINCLHVGTPD